MKTIKLADRTIKTLSSALGVKKLKDVMNKEYLDITPSKDVDRKKAQLYAGRNRGSVRLNAGRYYTAKEEEERAERIKSLKLP